MCTEHHHGHQSLPVVLTTAFPDRSCLPSLFYSGGNHTWKSFWNPGTVGKGRAQRLESRPRKLLLATGLSDLASLPCPEALVEEEMDFLNEKATTGLGVVVHTCNPTKEGRQEDCEFEHPNKIYWQK
jgi:hypothetical protein